VGFEPFLEVRWRTSGARAVRTFVVCLGILLPGCDSSVSDLAPEFGFRACYEVPHKSPEAGRVPRCGTDDCGPRDEPWIEGAHERFDECGPTRLAAGSLTWFEKSSEAATWRENSTARLVLIYPSESMEITARYTPSSDLSWEDQLRSWFERFPPGGVGFSELGREQYFWSIDFGDRGRVRGIAASDSTAVETMKALLASKEPTPASFSLELAVRRSSHEMDCYSVEADSVKQLDELPQRLREKRVRNAGG